MTTTVRDETYGLLRRLGLTTFFGNPGSTEETFLKDFPADFRFVLALQEASVLAVADGYAQATRRPALVNVHTAAGLGNAMGNLMTAFQNRTPLIVTAGQQTREMLLHEPWLTDVAPETLPLPYVKWAYQPVRAQDVPAAFMRAFAVALQPPAGPVFLSLPLDDWDKPALGTAVVRSVSRCIAPDPRRIGEFAQRLAAATSPGLIYGADVARGQGWDAAVALAEQIGAPVWAAPASERTPFPEDHPQYAGGLPFAQRQLAEQLTGRDLVLVVGAPVFRYYPWVAGPHLPEGCELLHITNDPAEAGRAPVGDSLLSDAVPALEALAALLPSPRSNPLWRRQEQQPTAHPPAHRKDGGTTMTAREVFAALRAASPADTVLVEESPSNLADLHTEWPVTIPDSFYTFASGGLGWDVPAAVGLALAEHDSGARRPVLAVIGDGSFQYSVQAIWTAAQQRLPVVFVVLRNDEYAILKSFAVLEKTPGVPGLDIPGLDATALATGYGCTGVRAETKDEITSAVTAAMRRPGPTVIEIPITKDIPPLMR